MGLNNRRKKVMTIEELKRHMEEIVEGLQDFDCDDRVCPRCPMRIALDEEAYTKGCLIRHLDIITKRIGK